jgi:asparagine synthase (glutamine-hydrolysing)
VVSESDFQIETYWKPEESVTQKQLAPESQATDELEMLLQNAVKQQLVADVPLGVFLSGGIDSSTVAAMAAKASAKKINTFSIGFEEENFNEAPFARAVAAHLQTDHHELIVTAKQAQELVLQLPGVFDEPFADSSAMPTMLLSQFTRRQATVALSGDGGDELFLGYGSYNWAARLANPVLHFFDKEIAFALGLSRKDSFRKAKNMFDKPKTNIQSHIFSQEQGFFSQIEITDLLLSPAQYPTPDTWHPKLSTMENQALFDLHHYLPDDLLVKVDRAGMRYGLEVRVPLLDKAVVEWALNLSPELKYRQGSRKYLLRQVLYRHVPEKLFDRPKRGFAVPLAKWLAGDLRFLLEDFLNEKTVREAGWVKWEKVEKLKKQFLSGDAFVYHKIWLLVVLHQYV